MKKLNEKQLQHNSELLIKASQQGNLEEVKQLISISNPKTDGSMALLQAANNGHTDIVKLLIPVSDAEAPDNHTMTIAAMKGHIDVVKLLAPVSNPIQCHLALLQMIINKNIDMVKLLLDYCDTTAQESYYLNLAANYGHTDIVQLLIPVSHPKENSSRTLRVAAEQGHIDTVKLLIPVSDPTAQESWALFKAVENKHRDIINLLIPVSDYKIVLNNMTKQNRDISIFEQCIEDYESSILKNHLISELDGIDNNPNKSVKRKI